MGRGPVIERKKNLANAQKGKVFSIHAKLISIAAQKGGDPDKNPSLAEAIEKAKKANVPADNIDRAIKKGTGEDKGSSQIDEIFYEGYAAGGVAIIAKALTDNKNRTGSNIRHIFSKYSGNLGESGSVSNFAFDYLGKITIDLNGGNIEEYEEDIINSGADDYFEEDGELIILTQKQNFMSSVKYFKEKNIDIKEYSLEYIPANEIDITDFDKALKIIKLIEDLEEDEDVEKVWYNYNISDDIQTQVIEAIEKAKFRT